MANKRRRQLADGAPEGTTMATNQPASDTVPESVPGSETLDQPIHESPPGYEQLREQRIKENFARMQKLGIADLSLKLKTSVAAKRAPRKFSSDRNTPIRVLATEPRRRSSRLQNVEPVSYVENVKPTKEEKNSSIYLEEGSKPEFYTDEHEKLLGSTELEWTFFVDGYAADGKRIYDPVKGKTCHQCRQKTLGHRTHCSKCQIVQGQFCGDCLYMRYGEHVLEAKKNPDWICPPCRGICNCSLCRQAKGWAPTGTMYKKIASLGYKSVAHYLIQTKRAPPATESEENVSKTPHSAKRSLAFVDMEVSAEGEELPKNVVCGQKLDYVEKEIGDSEDGKSGQEEQHKSVVTDEKVSESKDELAKEEECEKSDMSIVINAGENPDARQATITIEENGENMNGGAEDRKSKQEEQHKNVTIEKVGESKDEQAKEDECKESDMSIMIPVGENPDAREATIKIEEDGENMGISGKTPTAKKRKTEIPKDSIARRLRPRINNRA